ncbi:MAG: HAD-IC family P-type ATPase [Gammaproteobacteria bacterium]|nr:HAD-IC family P-type ATPase [Gammaproteobacteria bacterium]
MSKLRDGSLSKSPYAVSIDEVFADFQTSRHGLAHSEAASRLTHYGPNELPRPNPPHVAMVFLHQFASPLIYVLIAAALLAVSIQEWSDAGFITAVLMLNAVIGTFQEYSAQRAAQALRNLVSAKTRVLRQGESYEINARELVPGDVVLLESGDKIPADLRLIECHDLECDESLLTGESLPVLKNAALELDPETVLGDQLNMGFAATLVSRGRARGVVVYTGFDTSLGSIAADVLFNEPPKAPLQVRMDSFTHWVAIFVGFAAATMFAVVAVKGMPLAETFMLAVALAVSVIPEGLPVALTVALAIGMHRMARRNVIVRKLMAVEALGSCTCIATDKTGTLTVNQLTASRLLFPDSTAWEISGEGLDPDGVIVTDKGTPDSREELMLERLCQAAVLANEGFLGKSQGGWSAHGDAVDIALLVMAHKAGIVKAETSNAFTELATIDFESERAFSGSLNQVGDTQVAFVKGAYERLLPMCDSMMCVQGDIPLDPVLLVQQAESLAHQGYRVLALAAGNMQLSQGETFSEEHLHHLVFLGLVGIIDPLRVESKSAVLACQQAGIRVVMITGDHPATALAIASELGLTQDMAHVVCGPELSQAAQNNRMDELSDHALVYARVGPHQKLDIVQSLQRNGHFVAVSGDGANDAPALRSAQVGVAMGKNGTDVARETADLIITDDNFASIVAGIEEGRTAYANVRKVIFLLISTGAAELVLFTLALVTGFPLPLTAVQLLWLNLVTNGIQDVALAFEPAEGNELKRPPRSPKEPVFNRLMIERVLVSALYIGVVAFIVFQSLLNAGYSLDAARNGTLLLMVLFENVHVFNCRSETLSVTQQKLFSNPILLLGTLSAQLIHIGAMFTPWFAQVLSLQVVSMELWSTLLLYALSLLLLMELHKFWWHWRHPLPTKTLSR